MTRIEKGDGVFISYKGAQVIYIDLKGNILILNGNKVP